MIIQREVTCYALGRLGGWCCRVGDTITGSESES